MSTALIQNRFFFEQKPIYLHRSLGSWGVFFVDMMQILKDYLNDKQGIFNLGDYKTLLIFLNKLTLVKLNFSYYGGFVEISFDSHI